MAWRWLFTPFRRYDAPADKAPSITTFLVRDTVILITATELRMARVALGIGVRALATRAGLSPATVSRAEMGRETMTATLTKLQTALEQAGIEFGGDGWVRLRRDGEE
jgi:hypothetical protein